MKRNVTQNHSTAYTRRSTWQLYSPEAFDCSRPHPMQLLPSPQPLDNTPSVWSPTQLKIFLTSNHDFPWDNLQLLPLISALGTSRKRQAPCPIQLLQRVAKHSPVFSSEDWTNPALGLYPEVISFTPWAPWCSSVQYVSARFYKSSDNRDSSPQWRTYTSKRLPKTVFCCQQHCMLQKTLQVSHYFSLLSILDCTYSITELI